MKLPFFFALACCFLQSLVASAQSPSAEAPKVGVPIEFQLPTDGPLPKTYRVTLAITDAKNPNWLISTFRPGIACTVTEDNKGKFTELWDGLDDNHMPVPPGAYGVKGIYMPASQWKVDGKFHSVIPQYKMRMSSWSPTPDQDDRRAWETGDPVDSPLRDVDLAPDGRGVFYWQYLENNFNNMHVDLRKPINHDQIFAHYPSGGAAGGLVTCTDGDRIWSYSAEGGNKFVYRADGKFGEGRGLFRKNVFVPEGWVTGMDAAKVGDKTLVYVAQRGKMVNPTHPNIWKEDYKQPINRLEVLDGDNAAVLGTIAIEYPLAIKVQGDQLFALHTSGNERHVSQITMQSGIPQGEWKVTYVVPESIKASDMEIDGAGNFYLSDPTANHVYRLDATGKILHTFGKGDRQVSGHYDPQTLMAPDKLATWRDPEGKDRVLIVETEGPNRVTEWSPEGEMLRQWNTLQTCGNQGYAIDPSDTSQMYLMGQGNWLQRYTVDWDTGKYELNAVWPDVGVAPFEESRSFPRIINVNGTKFLTFLRNGSIYRFEGDNCILSSGFIHTNENKQRKSFLFTDTNGNGKVDDEEWKPNEFAAPQGVFRYWGQQRFDDLSWAPMGQGTPHIWRLPVSSFDAHGNPVFKSEDCKLLLTDPVFQAHNGTATATFGQNELDDRYSSDWAMPTRDANGSVYVGARGGKNLTANFGVQFKLSRYDPDAEGKMNIRWRTGRVPIAGVARESEVYGSIFLTAPTNGIVGVVDQSRAGYILYTDDGLYVDTIFVDERVTPRDKAGMYDHPGEFFAGYHFVDEKTGKIYLAFGKETPAFWELTNWTRDQSPVKPLTDVTKNITLRSDQIASTPPEVIALRGGRVDSMLANISPALSGAPALDGSDRGWTDVTPIKFTPGGEQSVQVQTQYDLDNLYIRWHVRTGHAIKPVAMEPIDRLFSHGRGADSTSFYIQGDPKAPAPDGPNGRAGDARYVFALVDDQGVTKPVVVGMYKTWDDAATAKPLTYSSPVGNVPFAHVAQITDAELGYKLDEDGNGYILAARLPSKALPFKSSLNGIRTRANFDATFGGHNRFWWSNADGSASRETYDEPSEANLYPGSWAPASFEPLSTGIVLPSWSVIGPWSEPELKDIDPDRRLEAARILDQALYPPDMGEIDLSKTYEAPEDAPPSDPGALRWEARSVEPEQQYMSLGQPGRVYHAVSWVYTPEDMELDYAFIIHWPQNYAAIEIGKDTTRIEKEGEHKKKIAFKKGWNRVLYRGYCVGYDLRFGMRIDAAPETLWKLRFLATEPKQ